MEAAYKAAPPFSLVLVVLLACAACANGKLTREAALDALNTYYSSAGRAVETVTLEPRKGCMSVNGSRTLEPERILALAPSPAGESVRSVYARADRERAALSSGVAEAVVLEEHPFVNGKPPKGCEAEYEKMRKDFFGAYFSSGSKWVLWEYRATEPYRKAGFTGGTETLYEQRPLSISGLAETDPNVTVAKVEVAMTPVMLGKRMGLPVKARRTASATFQKYDDGWRLGRVD